MKTVITVVGKDTVGILAKVSSVCAKVNANVIDVTQTVMDDIFCMIMLTDTSKMDVDMGKLRTNMEELAKENNLQIHVMHEDLFNSMHRI